MKLVKDIGEKGLLQKLQPFCSPEIVGDDGAVLELEPNKKLIVTTDVLVDQVHFSDRTTSAFDVGWRSATANLSDLAAMGAVPMGITVGLSLPGDVAVSWVEELYRGLHSCLSRYQTPIVGGDITRSESINIAITALGQVTPQRIIRRSNARVGDAIIITGYHGLSKAGLELLLNPELGQNLTSQEKKIIIRCHQQPLPRIELLSILQEEVVSNVSIGGMDSSDGLADAISKICQFSRVGAIIDGENLPIHPILLKLTNLEQAIQWTLYGGEDFELVLCLPFSLAVTLTNKLGTNANIIGRIIAENKIILKYQKNQQISGIKLGEPTRSSQQSFGEIPITDSAFKHF